MPVVPRGWCTRLIETLLLGSGTCARLGLPVNFGSTSGRAWYVRDSYKWNASRTLTFLYWAGPFHQRFEKGPNLVFDGRRGNRLRFVDWFPSRCKDFARTVRGGAGMRFAKLGQTKPSGPTGLGMRRPFLRKETRERAMLLTEPFVVTSNQ